MSKRTIAVMGANPAWQKTLFFHELQYGKVNRSLRMNAYSSGKGINFCRAVRCFGKAEPFLFQFAGGGNGERLCAGLDAEGIRHGTVRTQGETRCCMTCLNEDGTMTELIEPSTAPSAEEVEAFVELLKHNVPDCGFFAMTGSLPDGTDNALYVRAAEIAMASGIPVLADIVKNVENLLALPGTVILKVNAEELQKITQTASPDLALAFARTKWPRAVFAITNGPDNAWLAENGRVWQYAIPRQDHIVSPLGCGDTASAVLASAVLDGLPYKDAFLQALAAASANCLSAQAGSFEQKDQRAIAEKIQVSAC